MDKLFNGITRKEKDKLLKILEYTIIFYPKNSTIQIDPNENTIGLILEGNVQITKMDYNGNETLQDDLFEGNIFGTNISYIDKNETTIISKENSRILFMEYDQVLKSDTNLPYYNKFIRNLLDITNEIVKERNIRIQILTKKSIRDKLLEYFRINVTTGSRIIYLPFTFTALADYLAINRSAMQRELRNLKEEGIIEIKGKKIYLNY